MLKWIKRPKKLSYTPKEKWPSDINKRIYINSQMGLLIPRMGRRDWVILILQSNLVNLQMLLTYNLAGPYLREFLTSAGRAIVGCF